MQNEKVWIFTDTNSKTVSNILVSNFLSQANQIDLKVFDNINSMEELNEIELFQDSQVLYHAFENLDMTDKFIESCDKVGIKHVDMHSITYNFVGSIFSKISKGDDIESILKHSLENNPIEFALNNDDGSNPKSINESDLVIIGASRTSKTPLSIYMSHRGYKVTNIPLVPEVEPPKQLFEFDPNRIIELKMDPSNLMEIRKERLRFLGLQRGSAYATTERIEQELEYSHNISRKQNCIS